MICCFPFHTGDLPQLHTLLQFIKEIGGAKGHVALLVADAATPFAACVEIRKLALQSFDEVKCISNAATVSGWPQGPNSLFWAAARYVQTHLKSCWLWCETDCVPMKAGWLDALESEYTGLDTFMGDLYQGLASDTGLPMRALSGVAVYPANAASILKDDPTMPWDMANRELMLLKGVATPLIRHFYGKKDLPPTFISDKAPDSAENVLALSSIPAQVVLYHRNKDGTLIDVLRKRLCIVKPPPNVLYGGSRIILALQACNKDAHLLKANLEWMAELDGHLKYEAVFVSDSTLRTDHRGIINRLGRKLFDSWREYIYPPPLQRSWPQAPNHAFQHTARYMSQFGKPWFWFEADAWPLKPGWLDTIANAYFLHRKAVMGPVVRGMNHCNGVAVYPYNFCDISPRAMTAVNQAWDAVCRPDLEGKIHDASDLFHHGWGRAANGKFTDYGGIGSPTFPDPTSLQHLKPTAAIFHRCKDISLITQLRYVKNRNLNSFIQQGSAIPQV